MYAFLTIQTNIEEGTECDPRDIKRKQEQSRLRTENLHYNFKKETEPELGTYQ
jgi:hypothetical protein